MRIEKISDDQLKIILDGDDLLERNIKISELSFNNPEKMRGFFMDMMEQAMVECDFYTETDTPLIIEVVPASQDCIVLIITKAAAELSIQEHIASRLNFFPKAKETRRFRQKSFIEPAKPQHYDPNLYVFSFKSLDELALACRSVNGIFGGKSVVYKYNAKYYLLLNFEKSNQAVNVNMILREYGQRLVSSPISAPYLAEHGELLIGEGAVGVAAAYL